jgi:glycosyltransferase involved in cell wall biosynthesis
MIKNLVSIYITNYNYEKYIERAINSCIDQTYKKIEIIIYDDGSKDSSKKIINKYSSHPKITSIYQRTIGLVKTCNKALYSCQGEFIVRLDADDWFDENAISIMVEKLKKNPNSNFIFPDYYEVDQHGLISKLIRRHDFKNVSLKDQFAHGACTLFRVNALKKVGGYDEIFTCQDGVNIWLKFLKKNKPLNVNLPLFFYRKHSSSLTTNHAKIAENRNKILKSNNKKANKNIIGIVFVRGKKFDKYTNNLEKIGKKNLIELTLMRLERVKKINKIILCSPDISIKSIIKKNKLKKTIFIERPVNLANSNVSIYDSIKLCINKYENKFKKKVDSLIISKVITPFLEHTHLENAINTCEIFDLDAVIGIRPRDEVFFRHNGRTLSPLRHNDSNYDKDIDVKILIEAQQIYSEAGNFLVIKKDEVKKIDNMRELKIGHEILDELSSFQIKNNFDLKLARIIFRNKKTLKN